jgi:hypothetical protein
MLLSQNQQLYQFKYDRSLKQSNHFLYCNECTDLLGRVSTLKADGQEKSN